MPQIEEAIPAGLAAEAEAARAYFAAQQAGDFKLTGIVDPNDYLEVDSQTGERSLQLILCGNQDGQDVCLRERFVVKPGPSDGEFDVEHVAEAPPAVGSPAPLLDPPLGVRSGWLDQKLQSHALVVLLFYRGFW